MRRLCPLFNYPILKKKRRIKAIKRVPPINRFSNLVMNQQAGNGQVPKSAPYLRLKNNKRTSKCQVFPSTVPA